MQDAPAKELAPIALDTGAAKPAVNAILGFPDHIWGMPTPWFAVAVGAILLAVLILGAIMLRSRVNRLGRGDPSERAFRGLAAALGLPRGSLAMVAHAASVTPGITPAAMLLSRVAMERGLASLEGRGVLERGIAETLRKRVG